MENRGSVEESGKGKGTLLEKGFLSPSPNPIPYPPKTFTF